MSPSKTSKMDDPDVVASKANIDPHPSHKTGNETHPQQDPKEQDRQGSKHHPPTTTGTSLDDWKHRAPYRIHEPAAKFEAKWHGSCHCGRVTYQLCREKPLVAKYCHCTTCQHLHSATFQWAAIFHKEDINFTHGHEDLVWYDSGEKTTAHKLPCKVTCGYCRSPIMDEGRRMILLFPGLIDFGEKPEEVHKNREGWFGDCHMFYHRRVMDILDGKPKWAGLDNASDLLDDHGKVIKKKEDVERDVKEKKEKEEKEKKQNGSANGDGEDDGHKSKKQKTEKNGEKNGDEMEE